MPRVQPIDPEKASPEAKAAIEAHLAQGYRLTNEKLTLLHNVTAFEALEGQSYAVDRELQKIVGSRAAEFFEYTVSAQNECLVCSRYFVKLLRKYGVEDFAGFDFTPRERLLVDFGRALARDPKAVPEALTDALKAEFGEEGLVVITTMGVFMVANNYFNDILRVEPEKL